MLVQGSEIPGSHCTGREDHWAVKGLIFFGGGVNIGVALVFLKLVSNLTLVFNQCPLGSLPFPVPELSFQNDFCSSIS